MMSEATGSSAKVAGRSSATVAVGPTPGSTPTSVPSSAPNRQYMMLVGTSATENPRRILSSSSIRASNREPGADQGNLQPQPDLKNQRADRDDGDGHRHALEPCIGTGARGDEDRDRKRGHKTEPRDRRAEENA